MPREYRHIEEYREEILRLKAEGKTRAEIGAKLGFSKEQIHNFISRHNEKQRKIAVGIAIKKKGRPAKDSVVREEDKLADLDSSNRWREHLERVVHDYNKEGIKKAVFYFRGHGAFIQKTLLKVTR
jgi:orotate phosphoribosyltransferase-like protein